MKPGEPGPPGTSFHIILDGDNAWPDLRERSAEDIIHLTGDKAYMAIAALGGGTASGNASVTFRMDLPDGKVVLAETTLRLLLRAADSFKAKYGDPDLAGGQMGMGTGSPSH